MSFGDHVETRSELEAAELDRENRIADRLATNVPELTEDQEAEEWQARGERIADLAGQLCGYFYNHEYRDFEKALVEIADEIVAWNKPAEFDVENGHAWALDGGQVYTIACEVRQDALAGKQRSVAEIVAELMRVGWRPTCRSLSRTGRLL
jgi:hypothetical protein